MAKTISAERARELAYERHQNLQSRISKWTALNELAKIENAPEPESDEYKYYRDYDIEAGQAELDKLLKAQEIFKGFETLVGIGEPFEVPIYDGDVEVYFEDYFPDYDKSIDTSTREGRKAALDSVNPAKKIEELNELINTARAIQSINLDYNEDFPAYSTPNQASKKALKSESLDKYLTDEERGRYYYLYNTQGEKVASSYMAGLEESLKSRRLNAIHDFADDHKILGSIASGGTQIISSLEGAGNLINHFMNAGLKDLEDSEFAKYTEAFRSGASADMGDTGKFVYNTLMSGLDSLAAVGIGTAVGVPWAGEVLLGLSAMSSSMNDMIDRGAPTWQVIATGIASGVFESLFEHMSISNIKGIKNAASKELKNSVINTARDIALSAGINATEEAFTEVANILYDTMLNGDFSDGAMLVEELMAKGYSKDEAIKAVAKTKGIQIGESALSGGLMGAGFGGLATAAGAVSREIAYHDAGKAIKNSSDDGANLTTLLSQGELYGIGNPSLKKTVKKTAKKGEKVSARQVGKLNAELIAAQRKVYAGRVRENFLPSVREALEKTGLEGKKLERTAEAIVKLYGGKSLSVYEAESLDSTEARTVIDNFDEIASSVREDDIRRQFDVSRDIEKARIYAERAKASAEDTEDTAVPQTTAEELVYSYAASGMTLDITLESIKKLGSESVGEIGQRRIIELWNKGRRDYVRKNAEAREKKKSDAVKAAEKEGKKSIRGAGKYDDSAAREKLEELRREAKYGEAQKKRYEETRAALTLSELIAKYAGIDIYVVENKPDAEGIIRGANGVYLLKEGENTQAIYIDINAGINHIDDVTHAALVPYLSHEITHSFRINAPTAYDKLSSFVQDYLTRNGYDVDELIEARRADYEKNHKAELSMDDALEEVIARACEERMGSSRAVREFVAEMYREDKTLAEKFVNAVKEFIEKICEWFGRFATQLSVTAEAEMMREAGEEFQKLWDDAFTDAVKGYQNLYTGGKIKNASDQSARTKNGASTGHKIADNGIISQRSENVNTQTQKFSDRDNNKNIKYPKFSEEEIADNMRKLSAMKAVAKIESKKLEKTGQRPTEIFTKYFESLGNNIYSDVFGDISLSKSSLKSEIRHGITAEKIASIEAIPNVIHEGKVIFAKFKTGSDVERIVISAPIIIGNEDYYMGVMLQRDTQNQRLYLHNVVSIKSKEATKSSQDNSLTNWSDEDNSRLFITSILQKALNVKNESQKSYSVKNVNAKTQKFSDRTDSFEKTKMTEVSEQGNTKNGVTQNSRSVNNSIYDFEENVKKKEDNKYITLQSLYMEKADYQKKRSAKTLLMQDAPANTPEARAGQTSKNSISDFEGNVNAKTQKFSDRTDSFEKTKMTEVWKQGNTKNGVTQNSRSVNNSIPDFEENVNGKKQKFSDRADSAEKTKMTEVSKQGNTKNGVTQNSRSVNNSIPDFEENVKEKTKKASIEEIYRREAIREEFVSEIEEWDESGRPDGEIFVLGSTSDVLQGLGAIENDVYIQGDKIKTILSEHSEMTLDEIKKIPRILENPVLIIKSRNAGRGNKQNTRLIFFSTVKAKNGVPVMSVFDLRPVEKHLVLENMQKVNSAYTKTNDAVSFIENSEVLYADKNKTTSLLRTIGFQAPIELNKSGFIGSISYKGQTVNVRGENFLDVLAENKNRVNDWLKVNRLQLPLPNAQSNSADNIIPDSEGNVNNKKREANSLPQSYGYQLPQSLANRSSFAAQGPNSHSQDSGDQFPQLHASRSTSAPNIIIPDSEGNVNRNLENFLKENYYVRESAREDFKAEYEKKVDEVLNGTYNSDDVIIIGRTPKVMTDIGINQLLLVISAGHIYSIAKTKDEASAEGRFMRNTNYHGLGADAVKEIGEKISDPIMIFAHHEFTEKQYKEGAGRRKIIVVVNLQVGKKQVIFPIEVDAVVRKDLKRYDVNFVSTYFDKSNFEEILKEAIARENIGEVSFYYVKKREANSLLQSYGYQLPQSLASRSSFAAQGPNSHPLSPGDQFPQQIAGRSTSDPNIIIRDIGINVNRKIIHFTQSRQFKRWFGDWEGHPRLSSKVVDKHGEPKIMYGSVNGEKNRFYAESSPNIPQDADDVYLSIMLPFRYTNKSSLKYTIEKRLGIDASGMSLDDMENAVKEKGYDGIIRYGKSGDIVSAVAFGRTQVKSASENIGTYDKNVSDIHYSDRATSVKGKEAGAYVKKGSSGQLLNIEDISSPQPTPEAFFDSTATDISIPDFEGNVKKLSEKHSDRDDIRITKEDVEILRGIGRKSVNQFSSEDIAKSEVWAKKFYRELGTKSPFFRAWFGDWREYSDELIEIPDIDVSASPSSGHTVNKDVNKKTSWNSELYKESVLNASRDNREEIKLIASNISEIAEKAVFLDTSVSEKKSARKLPGTAFMHSLYTVVKINGHFSLIKLFAEEAVSYKNGEDFIRAYSLKHIKKVVEFDSGVLSENGGLTESPSTTVNSISDLFTLVNKYDEEFSPKPANDELNSRDVTIRRAYNVNNIKIAPAAVSQVYKPAGTTNAIGNLTPNISISDLFALVKKYDKEFSPKPANALFLNADGSPKTFYCAEADIEHAFSRDGMAVFDEYAENGAVPVYLMGENIADYGAMPQAFYRLESFEEKVEYLKKRGYDGLYERADGGNIRIAVFSPEQVKSVDNIGTFDKNDSFESIGTVHSLRGSAKRESTAADSSALGTSENVLPIGTSESSISHFLRPVNDVRQSIDRGDIRKSNDIYSYSRLSGKDFYQNSRIYSYDFLAAQADMKVALLPQISDVVNGNGKIIRGDVIEKALDNALKNGTKRDGAVFVKNDYTKRDYRITTQAVRHSLGGDRNRLLTNARIASVIGEVIKNGIPINALNNKADGVEGTYAVAALLRDSQNNDYVSIATIEQRTNELLGFDVVHSVSARQKNSRDTRSGEKPQGKNPPTNISATISIPRFLDIVNTTYQSILSADVLDYLGSERSDNGYYLRDVIAEKAVSPFTTEPTARKDEGIRGENHLFNTSILQRDLNVKYQEEDKKGASQLINAKSPDATSEGGSVKTPISIILGSDEKINGEVGKYSDRESNGSLKRNEYSYEALISKPDMKITVLDEAVPDNRADLVRKAKKNASMVGETNEDGSVFVYVDDINDKVLIGSNGLKHSLDRRLNVIAPVISKVGEILKNSIRINELLPRDENIGSSYVLIGIAKNLKNEPYVVSFVVNSYTSEITDIDVLYSVNAKTKKESAGSLSPGVPANAADYLTDSVISISKLLEYVNRYFPDILPESVLRKYGYGERPRGKLGESAKYSDRESNGSLKRNEYSYEALISKPDMLLTTVDDSIKYTRKDMVDYALDNISSLGYVDEDGRSVLHVKDVDTDIIVTKRSLVHGLDRRAAIQAPVLIKIGDILKNAIKINELTPRADDVHKTYVLMGAAQNENGELYITSFVVNKFTNEVTDIDILYSVNAKKESAAFLPKITDKSATPTDSKISISKLLEYVNRYFPDILPESVLRKYGYGERPRGKLGESAMYSDRESNGSLKRNEYSYEALISKPDMKITVLDEAVPDNRADLVRKAKKNAEKIGKIKNGAIYVSVDDINTDVLIGTDGLKHGLRRSGSGDNVNYMVTLKAAEILKRSVCINELIPSKENAFGSYVLIGAAKDKNSKLYVVCFVVNSFKNELESIDVLYAINAKRESAVLNAPRFAENPLSVTDSVISISKLLEYVNRYYSYSALYERINDEIVDIALSNKGNIGEKYNQKDISPVPQLLIDMLKNASDGLIDLSNKRIALNGDELWHEFKRHSNSKIEKARGQIAFTRKTFKEAVKSIYAPDIIECIYSSAQNPTQRRSFAYAKKKDNGYYVVVEAVGGKKNPNIVPVMILQISQEKWNLWIEQGKTLGEMFFENDADKKNALDIEKNKKNRVTVAQFASQEAIANTPRSPRLNNIIPDFDENVKALSEKYSDREYVPTAAEILNGVFESNSDYKGYEQYARELVKYRLEVQKKERNLETVRRLDEEIAKLKSRRAQSGKGTKMAELYERRSVAERRISEAEAKMLEYEAKKLKKVIEAERKRVIEQMKAERRDSIAGIRMGQAKKQFVEKVAKKAANLQDMLIKNTRKKHIPEEFKLPIAEFLSSLDFTPPNTVNKKGQTTKRAEKVRQAYEALNDWLKKYSGENVEGIGYLDVPESVMLEFEEQKQRIAEAVSRMPDSETFGVYDMDNEQLAALNKILNTITIAVNKANRIISNGRFEYVEEMGESTIDYAMKFRRMKNEDGKRGRFRRSVRGFLEWDNLLPYYAFKRYGEAGEQMFSALQDGFDDLILKVDEIINFTASLYTEKEYKTWRDTVYTFELEKYVSSNNGKAETATETVAMNVPQIMSLYCLEKRKQAQGHLMRGGIYVPTPDASKTVNGGSGAMLTEESLKNILSKLDERQIEVADALQRFMSDTCSKWGNKVSMARQGYYAFTEDNYFPIRVFETVKKEESSHRRGNAPLFELLNMGFTKPLSQNANGRIMIYDVFDVFATHTSDMARMSALALPMLDMAKWYKYERVINSDGGKRSKKDVTTMISVFEDALGKQSIKYLENFIVDMNGAIQANERGTGLFNQAMKSTKSFFVGLNLRTMVQQPISLTRVMAVMPPKYVIEGFKSAPQTDKLKEWCPMARWKSMGYFDIGTGKGLDTLIKQDATLIEKGREIAMAGNEKLDEVTWGYIWNAVEKEIADAAPEVDVDSDEFNRLVARRIRTIIYATQVVDSPMTKSDIMRSESGLARALTSFMGEPTAIYNMLLDVYEEGMDDRRRGNRFWNKERVKKSARIIAVYALNAAVLAAVQSVIDAFRDDDYDEEYGDKYIEAFIDNLLSEANPFNKLPYVRDIVSCFEGYTTSRSDTTIWSNMARFVRDISKLFEGGDITFYKVVYDMLRVVSNITGIGFSNMTRDVVAIWNQIMASLGYDDMIIE